jgi:hypothetical protein
VKRLKSPSKTRRSGKGGGMNEGEGAGVDMDDVMDAAGEDDGDEDVHSIIPTSDSREEELENDDNTSNNNDGVTILTTLFPHFLTTSLVTDEGEPNELVTCPICSARIRLEIINIHIDNSCQDPIISIDHYGKGKKTKSSTDVKGQWSKIMGGGAKGSANTRTSTNANTGTKMKGKDKAGYVAILRQISNPTCSYISNTFL